ncbi:MAG TPA: hypothetical protein VGI81_24720 [Tepidisphaeraceae bacterium]|jgi:hypothetical protein
MEQLTQVADDDFGRHVHARGRQQGTLAGQVADHQHVREDAVDGQGRLGEVGGPDRAGSRPVQTSRIDLPRVRPAVTDALQGAARQLVEEFLERRHADRAAVQVQQFGDGGAGQRIDRHGGPAARRGLIRAVHPGAQRLRGQVQ